MDILKSNSLILTSTSYHQVYIIIAACRDMNGNTYDVVQNVVLLNKQIDKIVIMELFIFIFLLQCSIVTVVRKQRQSA